MVDRLNAAKAAFVAFTLKVYKKIKSAQRRAILNANNEMLVFYWNVWKVINELGEWENKFLENLSCETSNVFPNVQVLIIRNLQNMVKL